MCYSKQQTGLMIQNEPFVAEDCQQFSSVSQLVSPLKSCTVKLPQKVPSWPDDVIPNHNHESGSGCVLYPTAHTIHTSHKIKRNSQRHSHLEN